MQSLWKLVNKPRIDDWSPLAKFYYADETLTAIASELDSFDGRRDPERCNQLVNKLRQAQDRVLHIIGEMLLIVFPNECDRACRDFRVKFPDEIIHDNLPGQLWFGAECLAAGSNIVEHESESEAIRPMAKALTKHLDKMREYLKDQALRDPAQYSEKIKTSLQVFDRLFAEFEFNYVSAMVTVKSVSDYDCQLDVAVLFSESITRAIKQSYVTQEQIDDCDPNVIIALPRLAIVWGLLYWPDGALNVNGPKENMSEMFRHFHKLLILIRNLLVALTPNEQRKLETLLVTGSTGNDHTSLNALETEIESIPELSSEKITDLAPVSKMFMDTANGLSYITKGSETLELGVNDLKKPTCERNLYGSSENLIHRLFVCIAGVADQLQTNYSSDVRKVLKMVLQPVEVVPVFEVPGKTADLPDNEEETGVEVQESLPLPSFVGVRWVPDCDCDQCTACSSPFTMVRRRHHCRNCGRIFCAKCSSNQISIPELGYEKKVRVCNLCFMYKVNPFSSPFGRGVGPEHGANPMTSSSSAASAQNVMWSESASIRSTESPSASSFNPTTMMPSSSIANPGFAGYSTSPSVPQRESSTSAVSGGFGVSL